MKYASLLQLSAMLLFSSSALAQIDIQIRLRQQPGWDPRAREGRCEVRVWVDHLAELRMRGDQIFVRALEGSRSYDEGSSCNHPLPYNSIRDFQIRQMDGRNRVKLVQRPNRQNNFTALLSIDDNQGGGDHYAFEITWRAEDDRPNTPAPFFDDIRACQDSVRQRFLSRNGRDAYVDFDRSAGRESQSRDRELIRGRGEARNRNDAREISYFCVIDTRNGNVRSAEYQFSSSGSRTNGRQKLK